MFPAIESLGDWGKIFQSIPLFEDLIRHIGDTHGLAAEPISNLTPGTNAVFRVGDAVYKIFAPKESGIDPLPAILVEEQATRAAVSCGVPAPAILAKGMVQEQYDFHYLILEYIHGREAGDCVDAMHIEERIALGQSMRDVLNRIATMDVPSAPDDTYARAMRNPRWQDFSSSFEEERRETLRRTEMECSGKEIYVHGDLTGENILLDEQGSIHIIDFADGCFAPPLYEYAPLFCELFRYDAAPMRALTGLADDITAQNITAAILLHEYGASMARHLLSLIDVSPANAAVSDLERSIHRLFSQA